MIVIYNPTAGRRRVASLWQVIDLLVAHGLRPMIAETRGRGHAATLARDAARDGAPLVIAAGGDGTIAEVAGGLIGTGTKLGIIPLGTANVLAHELDLPRGAPALAAALAFGRTRPLWPGILESDAGARIFVQMVGVGLDAQVVHRVDLRLKRALGRQAYVVQTLREITRYGYPAIRVRLDGSETEAGSVVVSKGRFYGGRYTLAPDARDSEPGFSVALFRGSGATAAFGYGAALALDRLSHARGLDIVTAGRIEILGSTDPAQADGDPAGTTPMLVHDAAGPLRVVVGRV